MTGLPSATLHPSQKLLASPRTKDGGLVYEGLPMRSSTAFIGSWFLCMKHVADILNVSSVAGFKRKCPTIAAQMDAANAHAKDLGAANGRDVNWQSPLERSMAKMQSLLAKQVAAKQRDKLLSEFVAAGTEESIAAAADVRSFGGPGAGAFLLPQPPDSKAKAFPDQHLKVILRDRLLLPVCPPGSTCHHRKADGTLCGALLDARGKHAVKCKAQGLNEQRHNNMRDWEADAWKECTCMPTSTEQHVPRWDVTRIDPQTGQPYVEEARLDVASSDPSTGAPIFMDTVVYCCHTADRSRLLSRARHDGKAAADAAAAKRRRYPDAGTSLIPLPFEAGGRPGTDTVNFVRRCSAMYSESHGGDKSVYSRLWHDASATLQIANAELIISAVGK